MDQTGDTRHWFNPDDTEALSRAEERFKSLTSRSPSADYAAAPLLQAIGQFEAAEKRQVLGATTTVTTST